jgi:1-acyl-sn-glycerol-3-phosphate acyltransferase
MAPWLVRALRGPLGALIAAVFRPEFDGWERLPTDRPFLLVANHSASGTAEGAALARLWATRPGEPSRLAVMGHALPLAVPVIGDFLGGLGIIPSTKEAVRDALSEGVPVLMFPGGDHEAWRPIWQANRVDLAGRRGFLRLARGQGVAVVPLGIQGSHYTVPILWRSRALPVLGVFPRLIGLKRMPVALLNVAVGAGLAAWAWAPYGPGVSALLAWSALYVAPLWWAPLVPWRVRMKVGEAIEPEALFVEGDEDLSGAYAKVEGALQELVTELAGG